MFKKRVFVLCLIAFGLVVPYLLPSSVPMVSGSNGVR